MYVKNAGVSRYHIHVSLTQANLMTYLIISIFLLFNLQQALINMYCLLIFIVSLFTTSKCDIYDEYMTPDFILLRTIAHELYMEMESILTEASIEFDIIPEDALNQWDELQKKHELDLDQHADCGPCLVRSLFNIFAYNHWYGRSKLSTYHRHPL